MSTWQIKKVTSNWRHAFSPPRPTHNMAIVVFDGQACLGLLGPQTSLSKTGCASGRYRFHFVSLNMRSVSVDEEVSAQEIGLEFQVYIKIDYRVDDAVAIAIADPLDLDVQVKSKVRDLLHEYDGQYSAQARLSLQYAVRQHVHRSYSILGIKFENIMVRVNADSLLSNSDRAVSSSRQQIDVLQQRHKQELVIGDLNFYAYILKQGRFGQLALLIADDSEKAEQIVQALETQHDDRTKELWALFNKWLDSDDAPLIADRVVDILKGVGVGTSLLSGNNPVLSPFDESTTQPAGLLTNDEDISEWIETIREEQTEELRGPFNQPVLSDGESIAFPSSVKSEAFAVAHLEGMEDNPTLEIKREYKLLTGISHKRPERPIGFTVQKFSLPAKEEIELDIIVHAPAFSISPQRHQRLQFVRGSDSKLLEFMLVPQEVGEQRIEVRFYYQRNWLTAVILDVTVVEAAQAEEG